MIVKQCSISGMRSEGISCKAFIMFNVSFIGTVKRDSMKLTNRSVERSRIVWIFYIKSVELVMCDLPVRGCSVVLGSGISCTSGSIWR